MIPKLKCNVIPPDSVIVNPAVTQMAYGYSVAEPKQHFTLIKPLKCDQMLQNALKCGFLINFQLNMEYFSSPVIRK